MSSADVVTRYFDAIATRDLETGRHQRAHGHMRTQLERAAST